MGSWLTLSKGFQNAHKYSVEYSSGINTIAAMAMRLSFERLNRRNSVPGVNAEIIVAAPSLV